MLGWKVVARLGVHVNVGHREAEVFVGADLQELVAKLDIVVQTKESVELLADLGEVGCGGGIERAKEQRVIAGFDGALERGEDVLNDFVGEVDGLHRRLGGLLGGRWRRCGRFLCPDAERVEERQEQ